jgi:hypothetical protein
MSTTEKRPSDAELVHRIAADEATARETLTRYREGGRATIDELHAATDAARRMHRDRRELRDRADARATRSLSDWLGRKGAVARRVRELDRRELEGVTLDEGLLDDAERDELRKLAKRRGRDATPKQEARYEELVGRMADEPGVLARRRDELEREDEMRAEATRLARTFLPRRRDPEPGSVELPSYLYEWLTNGRHETFDLTDLGTLAAVALAFANEDASLFPTGTFQVTDDGPRIVVTDTGQRVPIRRGADDTQHIRFAAHLALLARNDWIVTTRKGGTLTITPGERMRKLWKTK